MCVCVGGGGEEAALREITSILWYYAISPVVHRASTLFTKDIAVL